MIINPDLYQEITQLADLLRAKFSPTEFIPGCLVKSVADKSQYATNNGWIEAVCGQHNQQRVRWKSNETVAVNDFVDVLYFPDRRLFEAYGPGGAGAIAGADIPDGSITDAKLADMPPGNVKGRGVSAGTGPPTDVAGVTLANIAFGASANGDIIIGDTALGWKKLNSGGNNLFLKTVSGHPAWANLTVSETNAGIAEIATQAEVDAGTDDLRIVTPRALANTTLIERAYQNLAYNGSLAIWQRGTSFAAVVDGQYTADGWKYRKTAGVMVHTISQSSDVPTVAQAGILAPYSLLVDCTTIDASIAAGDLVTIGTRVEGFDFAQIAQRGFGVSFWVKATKTGIYCISFRNSGADRSYVAEFTIDTTATWEYKTVIVPASPSAGTWDYTTGIGLSIEICLAGGSDYNTTAGAWQTGSFLNTSNQVNGVDSASNDFRIALFDIFPGSYDRPFPALDHQNRFNRCLRYAFVMDATLNTMGQGMGAKTGTTTIDVSITLPVPMRVAPALVHNISGYGTGSPTTTLISIFNFSAGAIFAITGALSVGTNGTNKNTGIMRFTAATSWNGTIGDLASVRIGPDVLSVFSSEL